MAEARALLRLLELNVEDPAESFREDRLIVAGAGVASAHMAAASNPSARVGNMAQKVNEMTESVGEACLYTR